MKFTYPEPELKQTTLRSVLKSVPTSQYQPYSEKKRRVMELVPPGGCWVDLPEIVAKKYMGKSYYSGGGRRGMARRIAWDEPCLTLTTSPSQKQTERCHPDETRPFTVREYARIQSFPDDWHFKKHVEKTIVHYGEKLGAYDLKKFNGNFVDPIKMIFDKAVYRQSWQEVISNEIFRQRDKSNTNEIGYFHQGLFEYIANCRVPPNGQEGGWDVIYRTVDGCKRNGDGVVHTVYVEMKNKHNTMNSAAAGRTYIKMQNQLLHDDDCACFLVEAIARHSQDEAWAPKVDRQKVVHSRIRRVSLDRFYEIVTGHDDAFYQICMSLPTIVEEVLIDNYQRLVAQDTVYREISATADKYADLPGDMPMVMAMYMLGFGTYRGFSRKR